MTRWMVYGANGYTGRLVLESARARGHAPFCAGRSADKLEPIAGGLEVRAFSLDDPAAARAALADVEAVLCCAGPFSQTSRPMVDACIAASAHYLDITGEIDVFEAVMARDDEARRAGVSLVPGVGFDVVPSDCLAAMLAAQLPEATELELAVASPRASASPGTTKTMFEMLHRGGRVRRDGRIVEVPAAWKQKRVRFHDREREVVAIPWGDVSTAYHSTGIGNIVAYMALPAAAVRASQLASSMHGLFDLAPVQRAIGGLVERFVKGPDEAARRAARMELWGQVRDANGRGLAGTLTTPEGYDFTAEASVRAVERVLAGIEPGARTPSRAFGADFVRSVEGVVVHEPFD